MFATNRMARIALTGSARENFRIPLQEIADVTWKDPCALTNGSLTVASVGGSTHRVHFLRKHMNGYRDLYPFLTPPRSRAR